MATNYEILSAELTGDPLGRNYSGMTNAQVVASLTAVDRDNWVTLTAAEIFEAVDLTEMNGLVADKRANVDTVLALGGDLATSPGSKVRSTLVDAFGGGSTTITTLASLANQQISRASELGIAGWVTEGRVAQAKA